MSDTEAQQASGTYESEADVAKTKAAFVRRWLEAIELSSKEEQKWRKDGDEARKVYESDEAAVTGTAFNLYYSYIETVIPSLYNSAAVPDIRRRFNDKDPVAKEGADTIERVLTYSTDEYDEDAELADSVFDLATTGRGLVRVVYDGQIVVDDKGTENVGAQKVECALVPWASFRRGPARRWADVPWEAFAHYLTREQLRELAPETGEKVPLNYTASKTGDYVEGAAQDAPESDLFKRALTWEIWDKDKRRVYFIAPSYADDVVAEVDDPLGLRQFFPTPRPMMTGKASGRLVPLAPYKILKPIIDEIDEISKRITRLIKQLRPRAVSPASTDLDALSKADDGEIVEAANVIGFLEGGGMDKLISWFPMEPVIKAIQELYTRREQAKMEFFEVGGQADIMRGQSNPQETLGAQDIKQNWGSLRLKKAQTEVQRFVRDLYRLKAEIIAEKFTPQNLAMMTGVQLQTGDQQADMQAAEKWNAVIKLLKDEKMRGYRIDIETDSTIRGDTTRNQEAMSNFVGGSAQYFAAVAPMVEARAMSKVAAIKIYSAFARNFKLGKEVDAELDRLAEDALKAEQQEAQQGPPPNPEAEKVKAQIEGDKAKLQLEAQKAQQDGQLKQQQAMTDAQLKEREFELKKQIALMEAELKRVIAMEDMQMKKQMASEEAGLKRQVAHEDIKTKEKTAENDRKLKREGKDGGIKVNTGPGIDGEEVSKVVGELGKLIMKGNEGMAKLIAQGNDSLVKAITAPKTVKTPDGRTYTSQTGMVN